MGQQERNPTDRRHLPTGQGVIETRLVEQGEEMKIMPFLHQRVDVTPHKLGQAIFHADDKGNLHSVIRDWVIRDWVIRH